MNKKPTYEELEQRVKDLEKTVLKCNPAEEASIESEKRYRLIVENVTDIIWILDMEMKFTYISPSVTQIRGYSVEEAMAQSVEEAMTPASFESAMETIAEELDLHNKRERDPARSRKMEAELTCKDGATVWTEIESNFIYNSEDQPVGILGITRNITQRKKSEKKRKQVEEALRDSNEKLAALFQSSPMAIITLDPDGNVTFWNPSAEKMFGWKEKEVIGRFLPFVPEEKKSEHHALRKRVLRGEGFYNVEALRQKKDGSDIYISISTVPLKDSRGSISGIMSVNVDITEQKRIEESLRKSEEKFRNLFNNIEVGMFRTRFDGSGVLDMNEKFLDIFGRTREEMKGLPSVTHWADPSEREKMVRMLEIEDRVPNFECKMLNKQGEVRTCLTSLVLYRDQGVLEGTIMDITEQKRLEKEVLKAQKLESLGVFAGGIAHDFNNILTTILGNISMAKIGMSPEDEMFDLLNEAETASSRAQLLTKQLLTFAKGGLPVKEISSIKAVLKESSSFVLRGSKSGCEFSIAEDLWPAGVDVGQISQVINNVVINANQAMPKGGTIQVAAENLIIDYGQGLPLKPGRYIKISIKDQGVGIAEDHLGNIFDPYFTTKQDGSGLGLATTYSIIKKHDGHIIVESQPGVGTTFHIYLPAFEKADPEKEEARLIKGRGRILVMDDEAPLRKMVGRMLGNLGYESEVAKDGAEAIQMVKEARASAKPYDAVILDLTIPGGIGGKEAIKKLLEIDPEVKAIVSSGYSDDPVLANFQEYGFKGMMPKPFDSRSLGKVLHEVLKGEKE